MEKWTCGACGYVYDPAEENKAEGGVPFEKLSDEWVCPLCGLGKDMFEKHE